MLRRRFIALGGSALAVPALVRGARAQSQAQQAYPSRFVRLVVPFPPGGAVDGAARIIANQLSQMWGQQMVVENKGGAGGNIAAQSVLASDADGYTIYIASIGHAINQFIYPKLGYDPVADFAPVTLMCVYPNIMAVPNSSPDHSVPAFIARAKANPGKISYASSGIGTSLHLAGELFKRLAGVDLTHIPYRGAGPALNDLIPGRVDVMFNNTGAVMPLIKGGQLRALAVTSLKRSAELSDVPTVSEAGVPGFEVVGWYALFVPAKTPVAVIEKLHADAVTALADPTTKARLEQLGVGVIGSSPEELRVFLKAEMDKWGVIIKEAGIKVE